MIEVTIKRHLKKNEYIIQLKGHSTYAEKGKDIVCAYVSAVSELLEGYCNDCIEKLNDPNKYYEVDDGYGYFWFQRKITKQEVILLDHVRDTFESLFEQYPDQFKIVEEYD